MKARRRVDARRVASRRAESSLAAYQRRERREEGQILILFTIAIVVIMLFASIVIDLGVLRNNRQILVNAVDSGAIAGGTKMPVDGCVNPQSKTAGCTNHGGIGQTNVDAAHDLVAEAVRRTYPGIQEDTNIVDGVNGFNISYRCLIGINSSGQPHITRDIPIVCNPRRAGSTLGVPGADHNVSAADFRGAGPTRWSYCYPDLGDRCNVVRVEGVQTTQYSFGRVVGVNQGSTGSTVSAACNGPCGQPPSAPVDLVVLLDRTGSMSDDQIVKAREAVRTILKVYDPTLQRVALGFIGPSVTTSTCSGTGGPAVAVNAQTDPTPNPPTYGNSTAGTTVLGGATSLNVPRPGSLAVGNVLVAAITVNNAIVTSGAGVRLVAPGWTQIGTPQNNGTTIGLATYYKVITNLASEPLTNYTFNFTTTGVGNPPMTVRATGGILRYSGVDTANPINVHGGNNGSDVPPGTINATANAITTTVNDVNLIAFVAMANGSGGSGGYFDNWTNSTTERIDQRGTNAAGPSLGAANKTDTTSGNTNTTTATLDGGGSYAAKHIALRPQPTEYGTTYPADLSKWIPIGFTGTDADSPSQAWNEAYVNTTSGVLQNNTHIVSAINCFNHPGGVGTNLTNSTLMAAAYLQQYGRPNVKWGILLDTDGQPEYGNTGDPGNYTCQSAFNAATSAKAIQNADGKNIELFVVGFLDTGSDPDCPDSSGTYQNKNLTYALQRMASTSLAPIPNGTAYGCIAAENTDQDHFFCEPETGDLEEVFRTIATTFAGLRSHLIQLSPPPSVSSLSPATGGTGTAVAINGKYFSGSVEVRFGSTIVPFTIVNDTRINVTAPAGASGAKPHIVVKNDGGSSLTHTGSQFTYP